MFLSFLIRKCEILIIHERQSTLKLFIIYVLYVNIFYRIIIKIIFTLLLKNVFKKSSHFFYI